MSSLLKRTVWYSLIIVLVLFSALPNVLPVSVLSSLPSWYATNKVTKGLDLQGGSHLLLAVDASQLGINASQAMAEQITDALRAAQVRYSPPEITRESISLHVQQADQLDVLKRIARQEIRTDDTGVPLYVLKETDRGIHLQASDARDSLLLKDAVERSLEVVRRRLDETGMVDPIIARQGRDSILVQLPGVDDPAHIRTLLGTTASMQFHWEAKDSGSFSREPVMRVNGAGEGETYLLERRVALAGKHVRDASLAFNPDSGEPVVNFKLDKEGARRFAEMTEENIGRALAIVLDDEVITAPVIRGVIPGGSGEISGAFTTAEAHDLALLLRAGALPAPLEVIEERTVGPDLGSDAIAVGISSGIAGAILVLLFMATIYSSWGLIACVGLTINLGMIFGVLSLLGATMTLPGIAGLILVTGMAVDANILINERIRDEIRRGASAVTALKNGFHKAYSTILDSNITTLIAIALLFLFGSGPIRGFAITMAVGIVLSMFTAIAVTRVIMEWRVRNMGRAPLAISSWKWLEAWSQRKTIHFMKGRYIGLIVSLVLSVAALGLMAKPGLNYGIDFSGGTVLEIQTRDATISELRNGLHARQIEVAIQEFGSQGNYLLRLPGDSDQAQASQGINEIREVVQSIAPDVSFKRVEMVGPRVSGDFVDASILAILIAAGGMVAYLWVRFESHFALSAMLTLALDLTKTIGFFVLAGIEFNLTAIAALLALIGYSVNDKIVVFDRIRENLRIYPDKPLMQLFDESITSTLSRTLFTSFSTFLAIVPMAIYGGSAVSSFALPMLFGIVIGTSSSIWIAAPIVLLLGNRRIRLGKSQLHADREQRQREIDALP